MPQGIKLLSPNHPTNKTKYIHPCLTKTKAPQVQLSAINDIHIRGGIQLHFFW